MLARHCARCRTLVNALRDPMFASRRFFSDNSSSEKRDWTHSDERLEQLKLAEGRAVIFGSVTVGIVLVGYKFMKSREDDETPLIPPDFLKK